MTHRIAGSIQRYSEEHLLPIVTVRSAKPFVP